MCIRDSYTREELDIDLVKLARFAGVRFVLGKATEIDPSARTVTVPGRPPIPFDICSVDIGITSEMPNLPGFTEHATPAKPLDNFANVVTISCTRPSVSGKATRSVGQSYLPARTFAINTVRRLCS